MAHTPSSENSTIPTRAMGSGSSNPPDAPAMPSLPNSSKIDSGAAMRKSAAPFFFSNPSFFP